MTRTQRINTTKGLLFISPWILGFLAFALYPLIATLYFSFMDYSVLAPPVPVGTENYAELATDTNFMKAVFNTVFFAAISVPLNTALACFLAVLLNFNVLGKSFFRTAFFLPSLVPMVCLGVIWRWLLNGEVGLINQVIGPFADFANAVLGTTFDTPAWLEDPAFTKLGLVVASVWGLGHAMVIFLAGLQEAPVELYEAAELDGAGFWSKLKHVTIPMVSPYILFNMIMGFIAAFQVFAVPFVMMDGVNEPPGGPGGSMLFAATYIYLKAFQDWEMGYACAMALIFFLLVVSLTITLMKLSERRVYYAGK
ncbi:sugar ABC transporter permease [Pelagicoccus enzymogenes]|uniref:carbohydrate ABC transporter permease n=1 Tax=Pelagicoccus enzymogenes TaxID=2773457 RepID=UPI00280F7666|nr:sugar ABC transporter permease [Pelagicoccus enzymogenes]MDQ8200922.1 sugar ABC transporter permease [Pelagicoccus enzymogenes]